jgi:hypothetical protein
MWCVQIPPSILAQLPPQQQKVLQEVLKLNPEEIQQLPATVDSAARTSRLLPLSLVPRH